MPGRNEIENSSTPRFAGYELECGVGYKKSWANLILAPYIRGHILKQEVKKNLARRKVRPPFLVKFHGESNGDSLDALKRCCDPETAHKGLIGEKSKIYNLNWEIS